MQRQYVPIILASEMKEERCTARRFIIRALLTKYH
jgi:hypothetical protein